MMILTRKGGGEVDLGVSAAVRETAGYRGATGLLLAGETDVVWRWQVRASSYNSNKLTNQMQQFYKFITWRFVSLNMFRAP